MRHFLVGAKGLLNSTSVGTAWLAFPRRSSNSPFEDPRIFESLGISGIRVAVCFFCFFCGAAQEDVGNWCTPACVYIIIIYKYGICVCKWHSVKITAKAIENRPGAQKERSSSNHWFSKGEPWVSNNCPLSACETNPQLMANWWFVLVVVWNSRDTNNKIQFI